MSAVLDELGGLENAVLDELEERVSIVLDELEGRISTMAVTPFLTTSSSSELRSAGVCWR